MTVHQQIRYDEAMDMPSTVNIHSSAWTLSDGPDVGDTIDNCRLIAELGCGSSGRAFLAQQPALADRCIVLKVTNATHEEHINLARLQHTHIMPLYWATTHPFNGFRVLAMPYLAKTTLAGLLERLAAAPIEAWDGQRVFHELQEDQHELPVRIPAQEHMLHQLKQASWVDFVLRMGQTLAEALAFAHQRNLLHLDVKPTNIMITPDGQPILLDMDVARQPIAAGTKKVLWFGGTPAFMSPEQRRAMSALSQDQPIPQPVDERSDVYSLGMVLYQALGGKALDNQPPLPHRLPEWNPRVSLEVAQIIGRCLAAKPEDRYPDCKALAADLDRQLHDLPLQGVRDPWSNRWRKWRRRRPLGFPLVVLFASFCAAAGLAGYWFQQINVERRAQAEAALADGRELERHGQFDAAARRFSAGREIAAQTFNSGALHDQLSNRLASARRLQLAEELNQTVRLMRFHLLEDRAPRRTHYVLEAASRNIWKSRNVLTDRSAGPLEQLNEERIASQLQELMLLWSDLQMRLAPPTHERFVRLEVHKTIAQAEGLFGRTFAVRLARHRHGMGAEKPEALEATEGWEYCALARLAMSEDDLRKAHAQAGKAIALDPMDHLANLHVGIVAQRMGKNADAVQAFSYCLGAEKTAECFLLRGEAYVALAQTDRALRDFHEAIERKPDFSAAYRARGAIYESMGRHAEAAADVERAQQLSK